MAVNVPSLYSSSHRVIQNDYEKLITIYCFLEESSCFEIGLKCDVIVPLDGLILF